MLDMLDNSTITRTFAWSRAYLAAQNTMAATMCLRRVMKSAVPAHPAGRDQEAIQLAEDIAMQYMRAGKVDEAAELLRFAASWVRGNLDAGARAREDHTIIAMNPLTRLVASQPPPEPEELPDEFIDPDPSEDDLDTTEVRFEDDVTRIYRPEQCTASGTVIARTIWRLRPNVDGLP